MAQIDIYQFDYGFDVCVSRMRKLPDGEKGVRVNQIGPVTRSTLIRAQRMQLALFDRKKQLDDITALLDVNTTDEQLQARGLVNY